MKRAAKLFARLCVVLALAGCSSDGVPSETVTLYDIVTYDGDTSSGATFSFRKNGDSPLINLCAAGQFIRSDKLNPSDRLLIAYVPVSGESYSSGDIVLKGLTAINSDALRSGDIAGWDTTPIYLQSMWRSGVYINLECRVDYSEEQRRFYLVVDETTATDPVPDLYIVHDMGDLPPNFTRRIYASWDISELWNSASCQGVTVHVNDANRNIGSMIFMK